MAANRGSLIQQGLSFNMRPEAISAALTRRGLAPLNVNETQRIRQGMPLGGNIVADVLWNNPVHNIKSFLTGMGTIGAMGSRLITDENFRDATKTALSSWAATRGPLGMAEDIYNTTIGAPFNLQTSEWKNIRSPKDIAERVIVGAANNPLDAASFALPAAKASGLTKNLPKAGDVLEAVNAPKAIRQFVPSTNIARVNEQINTSRGLLTSRAQDLAQEFKDVVQQGKGDVVQAIRNVETGTWKGNADTLQTTKRLTEMYEKYQKQLIELGANPEAARRTAVVQSIVEKLNPQRTNPNIYVDMVELAIRGDNAALNSMGITRSQLNNLVTEGNLAFDAGTLRPLSHRYSYVRPDGTKATGITPDQGLLTPRTYGWGTPEQLVNTLPRAYEDIASQIMNAQTGRMSLRNVVNAVGRRVNPKDMSSIAPDEIVVSPRQFNDIMRKDFASGDLGSTERRLQELLSNNPIDTKTYGDDIFAIKREYLEPVINAASHNRLRGVMGVADSLWKFNALASPQYIMGNRIGNWTLNAIEGVGLDDLSDVLNLTSRSGETIYKGRYYDLIPKRLRADTSYQGILGTEFAGQRVPEATRRAFADTKNAIANREGWKVLQGINRTVGSPIIAAEAGMEFTDRAANFVRQAKRYAQETGQKVEDVLSRADSNVELYNQLNNRVINSLGDYAGRNWAINPNIYRWGSFLQPFFKFPTQMTRVLAHQTVNRPISMQSLVYGPARIGNELYRQQVQQYGMGENELGGLFYTPPQGVGRFAPRMLQQYYANPLTAGAEFVYNLMSNPTNANLSPILSLGNAFRFMDNYGNVASSPRYTNQGSLTFINDPQGVPTRELMQSPTLGDVASNVGATLGNMYFAPVTMWNRWIGPLAATIMEKDWYPRYSTSLMGQVGGANRLGSIPFLNFLISGKTDRRGRKGEEKLIGPVMGNSYIQVYPSNQYGSVQDFRGVLKKYNRLLQSR